MGVFQSPNSIRTAMGGQVESVPESAWFVLDQAKYAILLHVEEEHSKDENHWQIPPIDSRQHKTSLKRHFQSFSQKCSINQRLALSRIIIVPIFSDQKHAIQTNWQILYAVTPFAPKTAAKQRREQTCSAEFCGDVRKPSPKLCQRKHSPKSGRESALPIEYLVKFH